MKEKLETIKAIISDFTLNKTEKLVFNKTGIEEVFWMTWKNRGLEHIFAQHHYEIPKEKTAEEIADDIFFTPFTKGVKDTHKLDELRSSLWKRVKFVFNL